MNNEIPTRGKWNSNLGFILASVGSAVGLGNIWMFPYVAGTNGGGAWLFIFIICTALISIPLLLCEFTIGFMTKMNPAGAFKALAPCKLWWTNGLISIFISFIILTFYVTVAGWALSYTFKGLKGVFQNGVNFQTMFENHISNPYIPLLWYFIFLFLSVAIVNSGIKKGIEPISKILMPVLFLLLLVMVVRSLTLEGASKGLGFYLIPRFSELSLTGILLAISMSFISIGISLGVMITYGSYLSCSGSIFKGALWITISDLTVAFLSGLIIFPAVFAFGYEPDMGAGLAFITLPNIFASMPGGSIFSVIFFFILSIAALTSIISMLEVIYSFLSDTFKWTRLKISIFIILILTLFSVPVSLSLGALKIEIFGFSLFSFFDDILIKIFLVPLVGLSTAIFAGYVIKPDAIININSEYNLLRYFFYISIRYIIPFVIGSIFLFGLYELFFQ